MNTLITLVYLENAPSSGLDKTVPVLVCDDRSIRGAHGNSHICYHLLTQVHFLPYPTEGSAL
jgi:hypothetical protein